MYIKGKDSILFIKHNDIWTPISCETSNSFSEDVDMIGTTTRDNKGWKSSRPTEQGYSIDLSGQVLSHSENNALTYFILKEKKRNRELIEWKREVADYSVEVGQAYITSLSDESPSLGLMSFSMSLEGYLDTELYTIQAGALVNENEEFFVDNNNHGIETY